MVFFCDFILFFFRDRQKDQKRENNQRGRARGSLSPSADKDRNHGTRAHRPDEADRRKDRRERSKEKLSSEKYGRKSEEKKNEEEEEKEVPPVVEPDFKPSGILAKFTNTVK